MSDQTLRDLYCLECGYNLRGQSGDPRRCPECGHKNAVADLEVSAEDIRTALRRLETGPALCGGAIAGTTAWLFPLIYAMFASPATPAPSYVRKFIGAMLVVAVAAWIIGAVLFRRSCRGHRAWFSALLKFNLCAIIVAYGGVGAGMTIIRMQVVYNRSRPYIPWGQLGLWAVIAVGLIFAAKYAYRWGKSVIHPLQREVAARTARESSQRSSRKVVFYPMRRT